MISEKATQESQPFDLGTFLTTPGSGRTIHKRKAKESFFRQGNPADAVFYLQKGRAKLSVISQKGKEATVSLLYEGDFFGEESMLEQDLTRISTAYAVTACIATRISVVAMLRSLQDEEALSSFFTRFILHRGMQTQSDLVDQLFNSSERRLARTLLIMAKYGKTSDPETVIQPVTQEALAAMTGSTRSRISFFMNRFRRLGYIEYKGYNGSIRVHTSLLNMVLRDELPEENASRPKMLIPTPDRASKTKRSEHR